MNRKVKVLFSVSLQALFLMLMGVVSYSLRAGAATPSGMYLLQQMSKAGQTVSYSAHQTTWRIDPPSVVTQVWDNGKKQRVEYLAPPVNKGDIQVDDGLHIWRYHRSENGVVQTPASANHTFDAAKFNQKYTVKVLGSAAIAGRSTWLLGITAKNSSKYLRKYWVDKSTHLRLRAEYYEPNGQRTEATQLSSIHLGSIPATRFVWKTPAGAKVNYAGELYSRLRRAQQQASWLRAPRWLPTGYTFESAVVNKANNETWLRYSNGSRRFSIFEQHTGDKGSSAIQKVDGGWFWKKSGMRYLIAGLGISDAKRMVSSF
ncbi:MAG: sigma-E factor regulatory protein RseB domain-containing protein [Abditibacteriaceae bacterium]